MSDPAAPTGPGPDNAPEERTEPGVEGIDPGQAPAPEPDPVDDDVDVARQALESDPSGNGPAGLAGDLGTSSEVTGAEVGSSIPSTHGAQSVRSSPVQDPPPEQSSDPQVGGPETPTPADPAEYREQEVDPGSAQPHSHG